MPVCNFCGELHTIFAEWAACNSRRNAADKCGYDEDRSDPYYDFLANDIEQGRYDDDPNPYHGTYSEE